MGSRLAPQGGGDSGGPVLPAPAGSAAPAAEPTIDELVRGHWERRPQLEKKAKFIPEPVQWTTSEGLRWVRPFLGKGASRAVWAAHRSWVLKYDYAAASWASNEAELRMNERFDFLPKTLPALYVKGCRFQERGERPLEDLVATRVGESLVDDLASLLRFLRALAKMADRFGIRIKDFSAVNVAKGLVPDRPWLCIDTAHWVKKGSEYWRGQALIDIRAGLARSPAFQSTRGCWKLV